MLRTAIYICMYVLYSFQQALQALVSENLVECRILPHRCLHIFTSVLHTKRVHAEIADACFMHVESWQYSYETFVAGIAIRLIYSNTPFKFDIIVGSTSRCCGI